MKVVLDVGQYVSAAIHAQGHPGQIMSAWKDDKFELLTSTPILNDLQRVMAYPHIRKRHNLSNEGIGIFIKFIATTATLTPGILELNAVAEDSTDNKIISCAVEGRADYIVASDHHLLGLGSFSNIEILPPRLFLEILNDSSSTACI